MTGPALFDPALGPLGGWRPEDAPTRAYLEAFAARGAPAFIANLRARVMGLSSHGRIHPVTVNDGEIGDAYVCLPHTAYALYAKEELRLVDAGPWAPALSLLASGAGAAMRAARLNRIVHVGNWMLSTNLHDGWRGEDIGDIARVLTRAFPDHVIAVRSLNAWSDPDLCAAFRRHGWRLLPARQIYVTNDLAADWAPRRDTRRDLALLAAHAPRLDRLEELRPGDGARIADLYAMLYLDRYSKLNPVFTADFIAMTHQAGLFQYRGLRGADGALVSVVGCFTRGGVLTTPIVGYDTTRPPAEGLYRIASALLAQVALERGAKLNGSAGAASFKRNRGAHAVLEYTAYYVAHLSRARRAVIGAMEHALTKVAAPLMQARGL